MTKQNSSEQSQNKQVRITMLGSFEVCVDGNTVGDNSNRAHQIWNVLEYLIAHRHRSISNDELIEVLWANEESDNPANALKNLIYRIRNTLADSGISCAKELIQYKRGSYGWNNQLDCWVDCEEFEKLAKRACMPEISDLERIDYYLKAINLYKGDFLPKSYFETWVIPLSTYYHGLYFKCVTEAVELLQKRNQYDEIVTVCESAIVIDQFVEDIHESLIRALIHLGRQQQAMAHYEHVTTLFYRELGVSLSESLRSLYREIIKNSNHTETDLCVIKEDLREASQVNGAFVCEYEIFKSMYRLEARSASRTGQAVFVGLLTLSRQDALPPSVKSLNATMAKLLDVICSSLRRGDVVSRFSASQYVLMLPTLTFENGQMVLERITKRFRQQYPHSPLTVRANLQPLDPII